MKKIIFLSIALLCITNHAKNNDTLKDCKNIVTIGTRYGGWAIPTDLLDENSVCYLVGAGEDISFDLGIIKKYGCHVYTIDPTPRAQEHIDYISRQVLLNLPASINNSDKIYDVQNSDLALLSFIPVGLWSSNKTLKFYVPRNPKHVSLSINNLQNTKDYFELPCKRLSTIMQELGHSHITLLKLDIEGAEYTVLDTIFEDNIDIRCLCIEWDELVHAHLRNRNDVQQKVKLYKEKLAHHGYKLIYEQDRANMTFLKK